MKLANNEQESPTKSTFLIPEIIKSMIEKQESTVQLNIMSFLWFKDLSNLSCVNRQYYSLCQSVSVHAKILENFLQLLDRSNDHLIKHTSSDFRILKLLSRRMSTWPTALDDKSFIHPDGPNGALCLFNETHYHSSHDHLRHSHLDRHGHSPSESNSIATGNTDNMNTRILSARVESIDGHSMHTCNSVVANSFFPCVYNESTIKARRAISWDPVGTGREIPSSGMQLACVPFTRNLNVDGVQVSALTCIAYFEVTILPLSIPSEVQVPPKSSSSSISTSSNRSTSSTSDHGSAGGELNHIHQRDQEKAGRTGSRGISVGLANPSFPLRDRRPGMDINSFGYHSQDGKLYHGKLGVGLPFGPCFGAGDTIGCGIIYPPLSSENGVILFTRNGQIVGMVELPDRGMLGIPWFPVVGLELPNPIKFNFGDDSFLFNVTAFEHEEMVRRLMNASNMGAGNKRSRAAAYDTLVNMDLQERYRIMATEEINSRSDYSSMAVHPIYLDHNHGNTGFACSASSGSGSSKTPTPIQQTSLFLDEEFRAANLREIESMRQIFAWGKTPHGFEDSNNKIQRFPRHKAKIATPLRVSIERSRAKVGGSKRESIDGPLGLSPDMVHRRERNETLGSLGLTSGSNRSGNSLNITEETPIEGFYRGVYDERMNSYNRGDESGRSSVVTHPATNYTMGTIASEESTYPLDMDIDGVRGNEVRGSIFAPNWPIERSYSGCNYESDSEEETLQGSHGPPTGIRITGIRGGEGLDDITGGGVVGRGDNDDNKNDDDDDQRSVATSLLVEVASIDDCGSYFGYGGTSGSDEEEDDKLSGSLEDVTYSSGGRSSPYRSQNSSHGGRRKRRFLGRSYHRPSSSRARPSSHRYQSSSYRSRDGDGYDAASETGRGDGIGSGTDGMEDLATEVGEPTEVGDLEMEGGLGEEGEEGGAPASTHVVMKVVTDNIPGQEGVAGERPYYRFVNSWSGGDGT